MPHSSPQPDFQIHVDSECETDAPDGTMPAKRQPSDQTIIHRLVDSANDTKKARVEDEENKDELQDAFDQLQQAIDDPHEKSAHDEHVVREETVSGDDSKPNIDDDLASDYEHEDDSLLSEESQGHHDRVASKSATGFTESLIDDYSNVDESNDESIDESQYEDEDSTITDDKHSIVGNSRRRSHDEHTEALIQSAARAIVASIEKGRHQGDSILSAQTDDSYDGEDGTEMTYDDGTELTYGTETIPENDIEKDDQATEVPHEEVQRTHGSDTHRSERETSDSGSGGLAEHDDVFSHDHERSPRSSINSCDDLHAEEHVLPTKERPTITQEESDADVEDHEDFALEGMEPPMQPISRIPSNYSTLGPHHSLSSPAQDNESHGSQHSKVVSHPPFRSPSSVRALQMASPTPSNLGSPKQFRPTVSRLGTPTSQSPKKPSRQLKFKKEYPLVLLHVTVLPLRWQYETVMEIGDALPEKLRTVRDNWRLLQDNSGNTVLERGILLPHPQDSYETLEERLLDALELPAGPHARILKCGHYTGPPSDAESSDGENPDTWDTIKSCNTCGRVVRYEEILCSEKADQRFRIKVYASNGLMRAGAWAAAWKEMERIDVEIEPFIPRHLIDELENLLLQQESGELPLSPSRQMDSRAQIRSPGPEQETVREIEEQEWRRQEDEQRLREIYGHEAEEKIIATSRPQSRVSVASPRPMSRATATVTPVRHHQRMSATRSQDFFQEHVFSPRPKSVRSPEPVTSPEIYYQGQVPRTTNTREEEITMTDEIPQSRPQSRVFRPQSRTSRPMSRTGKHADTSLPQLLLAAVKVFLKDRKNVAILLLSAFVLLLAVRPGFGAGEGIVGVIETTDRRAADMTAEMPDIMGSEDADAESVRTVTEEVVTENTTVVGAKKGVPLPGIDYMEIRKIIEEGLRPIIEMSKKRGDVGEGKVETKEEGTMENVVDEIVMGEMTVGDEVVDEIIIGVEKTVTEPVSEDFIRKIVEEQLMIVLEGMRSEADVETKDEIRELGSGEIMSEEMGMEVMI